VKQDPARSRRRGRTETAGKKKRSFDVFGGRLCRRFRKCKKGEKKKIGGGKKERVEKANLKLHSGKKTFFSSLTGRGGGGKYKRKKAGVAGKGGGKKVNL